MLKKAFLFTLVSTPSLLFSDMVFDPVLNAIYSNPKTADINQSEYYLMLLDCLVIEGNVWRVKRGRVTLKEMIAQISPFLKNIGSTTAHRLLKDFEKNTLYFPDGSVIKKFYSK